MYTRRVIFAGRKPLPRLVHKFRMWRNDLYNKRIKKAQDKNVLDSIICPNCFKIICADSIYCPQCGKKLKTEDEEQILQVLDAVSKLKGMCKSTDCDCNGCWFIKKYGECPFIGIPEEWEFDEVISL